MKMEKWDLLKLFQECGEGGQIKENGSRMWIQLWYIVRTFINVTIYPSTTIKKVKNKAVKMSLYTLLICRKTISISSISHLHYGLAEWLLILSTFKGTLHSLESFLLKQWCCLLMEMVFIYLFPTYMHLISFLLPYCTCKGFKCDTD
jgi:hypothetical protein